MANHITVGTEGRSKELLSTANVYVVVVHSIDRVCSSVMWKIQQGLVSQDCNRGNWKSEAGGLQGQNQFQPPGQLIEALS